MNVTGNVECVGFYTTRFIEAETSEEAEKAAVALIRTDPKLKHSVLNERNDPPMVFVDSNEEVSESDVPDIAQGFTFFPEEQ